MSGVLSYLAIRWQHHAYAKTCTRIHHSYAMIVLVALPFCIAFMPMQTLSQLAIFVYAAALLFTHKIARAIHTSVHSVGFALRTLMLCNIAVLEGISPALMIAILFEILHQTRAPFPKHEMHLLRAALCATLVIMLATGNVHVSFTFLSAIICVASALSWLMVRNAPVYKAAPAHMNEAPRPVVAHAMFTFGADGTIISFKNDAAIFVHRPTNLHALLTHFTPECRHIIQLGVYSVTEHRQPTCILATRMHNVGAHHTQPIMVEISPAANGHYVLRLHPMGMINSAQTSHIPAQFTAHSGRGLLSEPTIHTTHLTRTKTRSSIAV